MISTEDMLKELLCRTLCKQHGKPEPSVRFKLAIGTLTIQFFGDFKMQLPDDKVVDATVSFLDVKGKPAKVDGVPVWAVDNANVCAVTAADDGMSAVITPTTDLGTAQISVTADADLGAGITTITGLGTVEVIGGAAAVVNINFGEPR